MQLGQCNRRHNAFTFNPDWWTETADPMHNNIVEQGKAVPKHMLVLSLGLGHSLYRDAWMYSRLSFVIDCLIA